MSASAGASRQLYLATEPEPVYAVFDAPAPDAPRRSAVLICSPWGWEEVSSYRSRREWARRLAAAGHPTLRFDLPATGNSAGSPRDPGRVEAWTAAIAGAAAWLRRRSDGERLAAIGLGLGGLLARAALAGGAPIDELVLWGAPASGRSFARQVRAFSRLQEWAGGADERSGAEGGDSVDGEDAPLPEGWLEAGGFVLSAETLTSLRGLGKEPAPGTRLRRALLLGRDGVAVDAELRDGLEAAGVAVATAPGEGWAELVSHAERTKLSPLTAERVAAWLAEPLAYEPAGIADPLLAGQPAAPGSSTAPAPPPPPPAELEELEELEIEVDGTTVRERPFAVELPFGRAPGILVESAGGQPTERCAVCLDAGAVRSIGPNRIWVETARRWAAAGMPTLRIDLEGIGEADGAAPARVADFYLPHFERQLGAAIDALESRGLGPHFLLAGLCGGGYWAFQRALVDPRVEAAVLLNSGALVWDPELIAQREARKASRVSQLRWWRRLLGGRVSPRKLWSLARSLALAAVRSLQRGARRLAGRGAESLAAMLVAELDRLREAGTQLTIAFSAGEPLHEELRSYGVLDELDRWPNLRLRELPGSDHTLRPLSAQRGARRLLDRFAAGRGAGVGS